MDEELFCEFKGLCLEAMKIMENQAKRKSNLMRYLGMEEELLYFDNGLDENEVLYDIIKKFINEGQATEIESWWEILSKIFCIGIGKIVQLQYLCEIREQKERLRELKNDVGGIRNSNFEEQLGDARDGIDMDVEMDDVLMGSRCS